MTRLVRYRTGGYDSDTGRHVVDRHDEPGCPPTPDGVREHLIAHLHPHHVPAAGEPIRWHHSSHGPWGAVEALHRRDRHDTAAALARLLRWTETGFSHDEATGWELHPAAVSAPTTDTAQEG